MSTDRRAMLPNPHCSWCGHQPHPNGCEARVQVAGGKTTKVADCPCRRSDAVRRTAADRAYAVAAEAVAA